MSFLFGKKSKGEKGGATLSGRDAAPSAASGPPPTTNGVRPRGPSGTLSPAPGVAAAINVDGTNPATPEQNQDQRGLPEHEGQVRPNAQDRGAIDESASPRADNQHGPPRTMQTGPPPGANPAALYPWSQRRLTFTSSQPNPFPRYGAAVNAMSSKEGEIYLMGGLVNGSTVKGDLWIIESGGPNMACYPVGTTFEGPGPRVGHASLLVGNAFIVFGGDTKMDERDKLDDTLYLLNTSTRHWSRALPNGFRPAGRYGHTLNILGSKIYIFGGQVEGYFFNDLVAFDLNALQNSNSKWELLIPNSNEGGPPEGAIPPARTNHTIITWNDKLFLFGGTNGTLWFNDVWSFDPKFLTWTQLDCIGYIPTAREGHSAALVGDVMYIFGGRTEEGNDLGDLAAFRITARRWYTFQNMGPSPSPRSGHSMTAFGKHIVVLAGEPSSAPRDPGELSLVYMLDTAKIRYPNDQQIQQTPTGERAQGNRRPSQERAGSQQRGVLAPNGAPDGTNRGPMMGQGPQGRGQGPQTREQDQSMGHGPSPPAGGSRLPRASMGQPPSGPPPQQQAPPPRPNGVPQQGNGSRSRTPTRDARGYGSPGEQGRGQSFDTNEGMVATLGGPPRQGPTARAMSPIVNGRRTPQQNQQGQRYQSPPNEDEEQQKYDAQMGRSRSRQGTQDSGPLDDPIQQQQRSMNQNIPPPQFHRDNSAQIQQFQQLQNQHQGLQGQHDGLQKDLQGLRSEHEGLLGQHQGLQGQHENLKSQQEKLMQELEAAKSRNAWYASEMALARKSGYQTQTGHTASLDEKASLDDDEQQLIEALLAMRTQLAEVQGSVMKRENLAAQQLAEIEHQRDNAIREATFAKAKFAAHGGSHAGTPLSESMSRDLGDDDRASDMGRKLAAALGTQTELRGTITSLNNDIQNERRARELAERTADAAQKRAADFEGSRNPGELETLRSELYHIGKTAREEAAAKVEAHAKLEMLEVDRQDLSRQLSEALESTKQHSFTLGSLREAVASSTERASLLERKLDEERQQREVVDRKLLQLRSEHEERTAELEETTRKLRDAEEMMNTHAAEANTHRQAVIAGLDKLNARGMGKKDASVEDERIPLLKQQVESAHSLVRKHQADADSAADKLRMAEERIAGLEAFQEQSSRESLTLRKQLQEAMKDSQTLNARHATAQQQIEIHQRDFNALNVKYNVLKELLDERERSRSRNMDSPGPRFDTPDLSRVKELEQQLESSLRAHQETKESMESSQLETEKMYGDKLALLEQDYQSAVHYVKGTEKMLKRMKDELTKYKKQNERLQTDIEAARAPGGERSLGPEAAAEWEQERQTLRQEIEEMQRSVKETHSHLEAQMARVQDELQEANEDRDRYRQTAVQAKQQLTQLQHSLTELEQLKSENHQLEQRAVDAERKVTLLLDQVGTSVGNYRRQSQNVYAGPPDGHSRNLSAISSASSAHPGPLNLGGVAQSHGHAHTKSTDTDRSFTAPAEPTDDNNRNSLALDSLASELETLRSQWADTHRTYRLSDHFDSERSAPNSATGPGNMSDSLANWRKRLDAEEAARQGKHDATTGTEDHSSSERGTEKDRDSGVIRPNEKMPGGLGSLSDDSEVSEDEREPQQQHQRYPVR